MKSRKTTRRALFSSVMALILCCAMLVGSTFAWFTDSVTSANNIITSGNLDVELYYENAEGKYVEVGDTNLLESDLWEPGHVQVVNLKIANLGTLALKYQFNVSVVSETGGTNVDGDTFKLSDYIKFAVVDGQFSGTREEAVKAAEGEAQKLNEDWTQAGELLAPTATEPSEEYVTLVVWMPETVGNEANYRGEQVPTITMGINLLATQYTYEEDSFDNTYDEDAVIYNVVVTSEEELVAALANATNGTIIGISGEVTWTTGAEHGSTPFVTDAKNITLIGVDENATFKAVGKGVGPIGIDDGTVTFKNLKIVDESESYAEGSWEFGYLEFRGNTVFENCDVVNAIMMEGQNAEFINCSFNSHADSEYAVWVDNGSASFTGCTFTGPRGLKTHEAYGSEVDTIVVDDCLFGPLSKKPGMAIGTVNADTTMTIKNSTFAGVQAGDQGLYIYETDTNVTTFNFTEENNIISAYVDVNSAGELADALRGAGQAGAGNTVIRINTDLDLDGIAWTPIKVDGYHGADIVTVDGQGHTIFNLSAPLFSGGFAGGSGIVIKDLTIADSDIVSNSGQGSGAFVECVDSMDVITLTNCHLKNSTLSGSRLGGLIGWTAGYNNQNDGPVKLYVTVEGCSVVGCELNATGSLGGIIGHSGGNAWTFTVIKDCKVIDCKLNSTDSGDWRVGVVAGTVNVGEQNDFSNITESGNTLTQTGKTAPEGQSNLYGRFVPGTTGKLTIDGVEIH